MGQLERYGLYVLCVVIFLILGVALWGDDPVLAHTGQAGAVTSQVAALGNDGAPATGAPEKATPEKPTKPVNSALDALREQFAGGSETDSRIDDEPLTARNDGAKKIDPKSGPAPKVEPETKSDVKNDATKSEPKGARPASGPGEYTIQAGDNLESIAAAKLGNARAWNDILKANPGLDARRLAIGAKIKLPARATPTPSVKAALAANEYEIKAGDTLEKIAKATLGKETRWREIYDANPNLNPSRLQPGTRIKLPSKSTEVSANR